MWQLPEAAIGVVYNFLVDALPKNNFVIRPIPSSKVKDVDQTKMTQPDDQLRPTDKFGFSDTLFSLVV